MNKIIFSKKIFIVKLTRKNYNNVLANTIRSDYYNLKLNLIEINLSKGIVEIKRK